MNRTVTAILGILALALLPAMAMAKSHDGGKGNQPGGSSGPAAGSSAYEHADEKAKFMRDTHDMGEHKGEEKAHDRDLEQHQDRDQEKAKSKEKAKAKSKESAGEGQGKAADKGKKGDQDQDKDRDKDQDKDRKRQSDSDLLLEPMGKTKGGKAK